MFSMVFLAILLVAVVGSGVMTGWLFWLMSRLRSLESAQGVGETGLLSSQLDGLTAELAAVRNQLDSLDQRTEFNERLLEDRSSTGTQGLPPATEAMESKQE